MSFWKVIRKKKKKKEQKKIKEKKRANIKYSWELILGWSERESYWFKRDPKLRLENCSKITPTIVNCSLTFLAAVNCRWPF